jgi:hypothetical protein
LKISVNLRSSAAKKPFAFAFETRNLKLETVSENPRKSASIPGENAFAFPCSLQLGAVFKVHLPGGRTRAR